MSQSKTPATSERRISAQHPDWPALIVGHYAIGRCVHGGWWIENADGEGMQVSSKTFLAALDAFWKENF